MSLYLELEPYIEYIHSIRKLKNYLSFDMKFPQKWVITKNLVEDGQVLPFEVDDENVKGVSFVSVINEDSITKTLSRITKIIKSNKEKELKEKLFKQYVEKLKNTFESNDITKLQNLYFEFDGDSENYLEEHNNGQKSETTELVTEREEKG